MSDQPFIVKNCSSCGHRRSSIIGGQCERSGWLCDTQRQYPDYKCDVNFSGWTPRAATLLATLRLWLQRKLTP